MLPFEEFVVPLRSRLANGCFFGIVFLCIAFLPLSSADAASPSTGPDFVLTQRSEKFGDSYGYVSGKGFKMICPRNGFAAVTRAPRWDIFLYNDKTRCYYQTTGDRWLRDIIGTDGTDEFNGLWRKTGTTTICGVRASVYVLKGQMRTIRANGQINVSKDVTGATYVLYEGGMTPPYLTRLLTAGYSVPAVVGIPLRLTYQTESGQDKYILETFRIDRCATPQPFFDRPNGYTPVANLVEVMITPEQRELLSKLSSSPKGSDATTQDALNKGAATKDGADIHSHNQFGTQFSQVEAAKLMELYKKMGQK